MRPDLRLHVAQRCQAQTSLGHRILKLANVLDRAVLNVRALPCVDVLNISVYFVGAVSVPEWFAVVAAQDHPSVFRADALHLGRVIVAINKDLAALASGINAVLRDAPSLALFDNVHVTDHLLCKH